MKTRMEHRHHFREYVFKISEMGGKSSKLPEIMHIKPNIFRIYHILAH